MPKKIDGVVQNTLVLDSKVVLARPRFLTQHLEFGQSVVLLHLRLTKSSLVFRQFVEVQKIAKGDFYYTINCVFHHGKVHETVEVPLKVLKKLLDAL
jgi:hypothetical protein